MNIAPVVVLSLTLMCGPDWTALPPHEKEVFVEGFLIGNMYTSAAFVASGYVLAPDARTLCIEHTPVFAVVAFLDLFYADARNADVPIGKALFLARRSLGLED